MILTLIILVGVISGVLFYAPGFLLYDTGYKKSDVIVLLLGPDFGARHRHARDLVKNGMADYLIIPAYHKIYHMDGGELKLLDNQSKEERDRAKKESAMPFYYEDTHIELIDAKRTMQQYAKTSAIFVSSPHHMRRIQIIVKKEFGDIAPFFFSPTPYEKPPGYIWDFKSADWKKVYREYLKITWFIIYSIGLPQ